MATGGDEELPAPTDSASICCGAALTGEIPAGVGIRRPHLNTTFERS